MKIPLALLSGIILPLCVANTGCTTTSGGSEQGNYHYYDVKVNLGPVQIQFGGGGGPVPGGVPQAPKAPQGGTIKENGTPKVNTPAPLSANGMTSSDGNYASGTMVGDNGATYGGTMGTYANSAGEYSLYY